MKIAAAIAAGVLAGGIVAAVGPAAAEDPPDPGHPPRATSVAPALHQVYGVNGAGRRVVCMVSDAGGVDCDFDRPTRFQPSR